MSWRQRSYWRKGAGLSVIWADCENDLKFWIQFNKREVLCPGRSTCTKRWGIILGMWQSCRTGRRVSEDPLEQGPAIVCFLGRLRESGATTRRGGSGNGSDQHPSLPWVSTWKTLDLTKVLPCYWDFDKPNSAPGTSSVLQSITKILARAAGSSLILSPADAGVTSKRPGWVPACAPFACARTGVLVSWGRSPPALPQASPPPPPVGTGGQASSLWCGHEQDCGCRWPEKFCSWKH